jgi:DNA-binding CsgD family transcriptional regulator
MTMTMTMTATITTKTATTTKVLRAGPLPPGDRPRGKMRKSHVLWIWVLLGLQVAMASVFAFDVAADWFGVDETPDLQRLYHFEFVVAPALIAGLIATGLFLRNLTRQQEALRRQLGIASGAFSKLIEAQFDQWKLSASERDVALLAIKGLSVSEMARIRNTREGTIKAQCGAVYRKAGVSGRLQLLSLFIEDLMSDPLIGRKG